MDLFLGGWWGLLNALSKVGFSVQEVIFFFDWKRHRDLLIDKNKYKRRMRNPSAKES